MGEATRKQTTKIKQQKKESWKVKIYSNIMLFNIFKEIIKKVIQKVLDPLLASISFDFPY